MVKEPALSFSPWTPWAERKLVKNSHLPGVYLLAHWEERPPAQVDPLSQDIIYIGAATDSTLQGRWQQFHRAAFEGKPGHSGGLKYHDTFGETEDILHVAAFAPESLSREMRPIFLRYIERKLIWEWSVRWDGPPICNAG